MRIAQVAPLVESVPPKGYGGTELIVSLLTEELVARGHEVTLFATADSQTKAHLIAGAPCGLRHSVSPSRWPAYDLAQLLQLTDRQNEFDIVHNHMGYIALPYLNNLKCPVVSTSHNLIQDYNKSMYLRFAHLPIVAISNTYKQLNYPGELNYIDTIYHGINVAAHTFNADAKRSYLLFLGRVCADKGTAEAIEIARRVGLPLKIAGKVDLNDQAYFDTKIKPLLGADIEYLGEVSFTEKNDLFQHTIATVYPISFAEPFGLVMVESLACGVPVLALNYGSVSEVLSDPAVAVMGNTVTELVNRFSEIASISRQACRNYVINKFSQSRMTDAYEAVYQKLLTTHQTS